METVRALASVQGALTVGDRQAGGGKRQADAFRQALQQQGQQAGKGETRAAERPVRPALQVSAPDDRRDGQARHVDVIA